jgi:hypothetical protein
MCSCIFLKSLSLVYNILTNDTYAYIFYSLAASSECPVNNICNASEQVPSTISQGDPNPVEDCPCVNENPFMHVMTKVTEDTTQTVGWKKRYLLSYNDVACHLKFALTSKVFM